MPNQAERARARAHDIMERDVITVDLRTPILDVHRLFVEEEIHGAPVVGEDGIVLGVLSALDLLRAVRDVEEPGAAMTSTTYFRQDLPYSGPDWIQTPVDFQDRVRELTAEDVMTRQIVSVRPDTWIDEVARIMLDQRIHRVLVVDDGALVGLITTFDLLRVIHQPAQRDEPQPAIRHTGYSR